MTQQELLSLGYRYLFTVEETQLEIWAQCIDETENNRLFSYYYFSPKLGETVGSLNCFSEKTIELLKEILHNFN